MSCVWVFVVLVGSVVIGASIFGLGSMFCAVFLSRVIRLSCRVSDFVMGGVILYLHQSEVFGLMAILFGLGGGRYLWFTSPFWLLCLFGL